MSSVMLATETEDLGLVPSKTSTTEAQKVANETGKTVTVRHPTTDKVIAKIMPAAKAAKAKQASKPAKAKAGKAKAVAAAKPPKAKAVKATTAKPKTERKPRGRVAEILKLASRKNGVSPAELNALTEWRGAPWRWLLSNRQSTGYCDRWGFKLKVTAVPGDGTRYFASAR